MTDKLAEFKETVTKAIEGVPGLKVMSDPALEDFLSSIPSLEELEANRIAQAAQNNRVALQEGSPETTAIMEALWTEAKDQNPETLPAFLKKISSDYQHDYGTICQAVAMAAIAAAWAFDRGLQGGITGFQAGAVMLSLIHI